MKNQNREENHWKPTRKRIEKLTRKTIEKRRQKTKRKEKKKCVYKYIKETK